MGRMDLCAGLLMLAFVLFAAGAVIYFAFKAFLAVLKAIFIPAAAQEPVERPRRRQQCFRCGSAFPAREPRCPECGLDPEGPVARDLRDLETTARSIQALKDSG